MKLGTTDYEYRIFGLRRSGNHAIGIWLVHHFPNRSVYWINNINPRGMPDFFTDTIFTDFNVNQYNNAIGRYISSAKKPVFVPKIESSQKFAADHKYCLVHSYEDKPLDLIQEINKQKNGKSTHLKNIIIVRDIRNMTASRIKSDIEGQGGRKRGAYIFENGKRHKKMYLNRAKEYYREALGITNSVPDKVIVNYNKWFQDQDYRQEISKSLGLDFTDLGLECMIKKAESSFDGTRFADKAQKMDVLNRWQSLKDHPKMLWALKDKELVELSDQLFEV